MTVDIEKLKVLAESSQEWSEEIGEREWYAAGVFQKPYFSGPDAEFIASASPAAVLELIAENEALRKDAERYRWLSKRDRWASVGADFGPGGVYRQHRVCWHVGDNWPQVEGHSMGEAIDAAMSKDASHD
ncbi:hypothetical protein N015_13235 [Pseudomonas asturiensis]|uniref:Uncharacterized protein n=1 Tax=Pseudomonas asturiensis TaxID=1190415 RepID=A0ABX6HCT8_9PSED|nr:hypothetical protein [Pseudomonas asturiensis]QHF03317.1 hypothetical protein N015_13235 [Pseudomonas asturiensis]